jgi:hypothetical protein
MGVDTKGFIQQVNDSASEGGDDTDTDVAITIAENAGDQRAK